MPFTGAIARHPKAVPRLLEIVCVLLILLGVLSVSLQARYNDAVDDIQQSRIDIAWNTCQSTNMRNRNTKRSLDQIIAKVPAAQKARAEASRVATGLLIDALAPVVDCENQLDQRFGKGHVAPSDLP